MERTEFTVGSLALILPLLFCAGAGFLGAFFLFYDKNYAEFCMAFGAGIFCTFISFACIRYISSNCRFHAIIQAIAYFILGNLCFLGAFFSFQDSNYTGLTLLCFAGFLCIIFSINGIRRRGYDLVIKDTILVGVKIKKIFASATPDDILWRECLITLVIPDTVTSISDGVFAFCKCLKSVSIPDSVISIGEYAFLGCISVRNFKIPNSVTSIGKGTFSTCSSLTNLIVSKDHPVYRANEGALFDKKQKRLHTYLSSNKETSYEIPTLVTSIGKDAFYGCNSLKSIEIPNSVTSIEKGAFSNCSVLTNLIVSEDHPIYSVSEGILFDKKQKVLHTYLSSNKETSYEIPDSVTSIGEIAFCGCSNLKSVEIPNSVTNIGENAFESCYSLITIKVSENHPTYRFKGKTLFDKKGNVIHTCLGSIKRSIKIFFFVSIFFVVTAVITLWILYR